ncbi:unnamed protein product, partial [Ranitomeya imitator]
MTCVHVMGRSDGGDRRSPETDDGGDGQSPDTDDGGDRRSPDTDDGGDGQSPDTDDGGDRRSPDTDDGEETGGHQILMMEEAGGHQILMMEGTGSHQILMMEVTGGHQILMIEETGGHQILMMEVTGGHQILMMEETGGHQILMMEILMMEVTGGHQILMIEETGGHQILMMEVTGGHQILMIEETGGHQILMMEVTGGHQILMMEETGGHQILMIEETGGHQILMMEVTGGHQILMMEFTNSPTHEDGNTLDLVFSRSGLLHDFTNSPLPLSDHNLLSFSVKNCLLTRDTPTYHTYRNTRTINTQQLMDNLHTSLAPISSLSCPDLSLSHFNITLKNALDEAAPSTRRKTRHRQRQPWHTMQTRFLQRCSRCAERQWRKSLLAEAFIHYKFMLKTYNSALHLAKQSYFTTIITSLSNNPKRLFETLNSLMKPKVQTPISNLSGEDLATYFLEKINHIHQDISAHSPQCLDPLPCRTSSSLDIFEPVSEEEVSKLIASARPTTCNSIFPSSFKHAIITPLLKKPSLSNILGLDKLNMSVKRVLTSSDCTSSTAAEAEQEQRGHGRVARRQSVPERDEDLIENDLLISLVHDLPYLGHVPEYRTPCAFCYSSNVAALKYGKTDGKWHLGSFTLDFPQFMGSYFAPFLPNTLLATLLAICHETLDCSVIALQKFGNFQTAASLCKTSHNCGLFRDRQISLLTHFAKGSMYCYAATRYALECRCQNLVLTCETRPYLAVCDPGISVMQACNAAYMQARV